MHIEEQRWAPLSGTCAIKPGGFGWSEAHGSPQHDKWWEFEDLEEHHLLFHVDYRGNGGSGVVAGAFISRGCSEFSTYEHSWLPVTDTVETIDLYLDHGFGDKKPARIVDIDISTLNPQQPFNAILVPNYGAAGRAWWWGHGATAQNIIDICHGKPWAKFTDDGIQKKVVSIARQPSGHFAFVLNELKPGDVKTAFRYDMTVTDIKAFVKGQPWGGHPGDGIERRLVSAKRYQPGSWTILYVRKNGVDWRWFWGHSWQEIFQDCLDHNRRIVFLERYSSSPNQLTAVLVQNK